MHNVKRVQIARRRIGFRRQLMIGVVCCSGVVTKPDLIDVGTERGLIDIVNNKTYPLEMGYSCVRCRGQKAIDDGQTLAEAIQQDEDFFGTKDHFRLFLRTWLTTVCVRVCVCVCARVKFTDRCVCACVCVEIEHCGCLLELRSTLRNDPCNYRSTLVILG